MNQLSPNTKQFLQAKSNDYGGIEDGTCQYRTLTHIHSRFAEWWVQN
ncbi:MAG: hypothetical protein HC936_01970 [Leptolyngbyaceae cyanobacterium SU_3_3]|nr:hypothetical protein [Leptolyngbyaceae cyanobacterium SU_3_3]